MEAKNGVWQTYQGSSGNDTGTTRQEILANDVLHDHQGPSEFCRRVRTVNEY